MWERRYRSAIEQIVARAIPSLASGICPICQHVVVHSGMCVSTCIYGVSVCKCFCVSVHPPVCVCLCVSMCAYVCLCVPTCVYVGMCAWCGMAPPRVCVCVFVCAYIHTYIQAYIHASMPAHIRPYVHEYIHAHVYLQQNRKICNAGRREKHRMCVSPKGALQSRSKPHI